MKVFCLFGVLVSIPPVSTYSQPHIAHLLYEASLLEVVSSLHWLRLQRKTPHALFYAGISDLKTF